MKVDSGRRFWGKLLVLSLFFTLCIKFVPSISALTIYPSFTDISGEGGESFKRTITLVNNGEELQVFLLEGADVHFNQEGVPQFLTVEDIPPDSMLWWLSYDKGPYTLAPGEEKEIPISISIPKTPDPGGHYGALLVSRFNPVGEKQPAARLESKVASLIFANVEGEVDRSFSIVDFSADKGLYTSLPVFFRLLARSDANTHLQPYGTVSVYNNLTHKKVAQLLVNDDFAYLFPGTARLFPVEWKARGLPPFWPLYFGKYTALLELKTIAGSTITAETSFWVIPFKIIFIFAAMALAAFFGFRYYGRLLVRRSHEK